MMESAFILPFIAVMLVLIVYFGWNFRRLAVVTNMDRYVVWEQATPGAPGPDAQYLPNDMRNPRLNDAFFGLHSDQAERLNEHAVELVFDADDFESRQQRAGYTPMGHELLRDLQTDETFSYFDDFIERNPRALRERFEATHEQLTDSIEFMNLNELGRSTRNNDGHSRLNGDWRFANGIRYDGRTNKWIPAYTRVAPGESLREVFFADLDDGLEPYDSGGNNLAQAIREFYLSYPTYRGPDVTNWSRNGNVPNINQGGASGGF